MFTIHAGEYLVGNHIETKFKRWNVWIPSKDTGVDLLVTNKKNQRTVSLQVKFSKDFPKPVKSPDRQALRSHGWFTLSMEKIDPSKAEFWVFVLHGFESDKTDFLVVPTAKLRQHMDEIHDHQEKLQIYLTSTNKNKCWETRGLKIKDRHEIANDTYKNHTRDLSRYLNDTGWNALKAKLDR